MQEINIKIEARSLARSLSLSLSPALRRNVLHWFQ